MAIYIYTAKTSPNKILQGSIEAESEQEVVNRLTKMGYFPVSIKAEVPYLNQGEIWKLKKIKPEEIISFTQQLSTLIESGVNIIESLRIISNQINNKYLKAVLNDVIAKIKDGNPLSASLALYPHNFSGLYIAMIKLGEAGGNIQGSLKRLANFLEKERELKNSIRSALIYPAFIFVVSILTIIVLIGFVIPRLVTMFEDMGQILPLPTKLLILVSGFLRDYWWLIFASCGALIFVYKRMFRLPRVRFALSEFKLKIPVWGKLSLKTDTSRLMRALSLLLSQGLTIIYSLEVSAAIINNEVLKNEVSGFKKKISEGANLSRCLTESKYFPPYVANIAGIGEESGALEKSLMRIADDYEGQVDRFLKNFAQILEPLMILGMGLIVGFIVLSMMLPIFQINLIVK
jgi:type II secretory pathway component PulF